MGLSTYTTVTDQDIRTISSTQGGEPYGQRAKTSDGRVYAYCLAGAADLAAGKIAINGDVVANHINQTFLVYAAGTSVIAPVLGATLATLNQYAGGYFVTRSGTAPGQSLLIAGNTAAALSAATTITLQDPLIVATDATTKYSLYAHPYSNCVISATDQADFVTGVPNVIITTAYYGWLQTGGVCSVLADDTAPADGVSIAASDATAGAIGTADVAGVTIIGSTIAATTSTAYEPVWLSIAF